MKKGYTNSLRKEVLDRISHQKELSDREVYREIDSILLTRSHEEYSSLESMLKYREAVFDSIRRFGVLEPYLNDDQVTEIMIVGSGKIFIERCGVIIRTDQSFFDEEEVYRLIDQIVAPTNRMVNESRPVADSRLPDGSRVHIVLPPVSLVGPVITIRKFRKGGMTIEDLIRYGEFPPELAPVLRCYVKGRYSILLSGATNSGKSSLLNALGAYIGEKERIITIEDSAELQMFHIDNLVRLETRDPNVEGENEVTMEDLIKASLRMRPDRIIVGEVRGAEAMAMLQALSTGHNGSFSSIHANSCRDALRRLETMVLMGVDMPLKAIQGLIGSAVDILIHLERTANGERRLTEIVELVDFDGTDYQMNPLFGLRSDEGGTSVLSMIHDLSERKKMVAAGIWNDYKRAVMHYQSCYGRD